MKVWFKRHRWNVIIALGMVMIVWVGPYLKWRMTSSAVVFSTRMILVPVFLPEELDVAFKPLAKIDGWITGEPVQLSRIRIGATAIF